MLYLCAYKNLIVKTFIVKVSFSLILVIQEVGLSYDIMKDFPALLHHTI
uniref:Uncharacterized protein n=1 Tax=Anguilla anguilla TaxID=7936 RepID=A0A0E9S978_ANGAN